MTAPSAQPATSIQTDSTELVLVTGGLGFIGTQVVQQLADSGVRSRIVDLQRADRAALPLPPDTEVITADIRDAEAMRSAVAGCRAIVHLAALTSVQDSLATPVEALDVNVRGTQNVLEAAREHGITRFVLASSNAAAGEHPPPLTEDLVPRPLSPYGASKLGAEAFCSAYQESYGISPAILRFANVYGPGSLYKSSVIAKFIRLVLAGETVTIYGDGRQTRDFIHVADVARAVVAAVQRPEADGLYQIGAGRETSVLEIIGLIEQVTGRDITVEHLDPLPGEIMRNCVDPSRAREYLGWSPTVELADGLAETYEWLAAAIAA